MTTETDSITSSPSASPDSAGTSSSAPATSAESGPFSDDYSSTDFSSGSSNPAEAAMARAMASMESDSTSNDLDPSQTATSDASEDQATDLAREGASSQEDASESGATEADPNGSEEDPNASRSQEPLAAPESWATDRKDKFGKLDSDSQKLVLDMYEDMNGGLNKAFQKLADERKAVRDNFGADATAVKELVELGREFESDPIKVISRLAEQAAKPVFFTPQSDDQIPQFESQEEQTRWIQESIRNQAQADREADRRRQDAERDTSERINNELAEALRLHTDLPDHKDAVLSLMAEKGVTATDAYRLSTYEKVAEMAREGHTLKGELEKLRAENETLKKASTKPAAREIGDAQAVQEESHLSEAEKAMKRAQRAINQR